MSGSCRSGLVCLLFLQLSVPCSLLPVKSHLDQVIKVALEGLKKNPKPNPTKPNNETIINIIASKKWRHGEVERAWTLVLVFVFLTLATLRVVLNLGSLASCIDLCMLPFLSLNFFDYEVEINYVIKSVL